MKVKEFFQQNGITFNASSLRRSEKTYEKSDVNQAYYKLPAYVDGFNFMTISLNGTEALEAKEIKLGELEMSFDKEYGWKAQLPDSTQVWEGVEF